ncbi:4Fe-4S binding protein [Candidatus Xianfuyuplasma coldseepsis]|uniref:4Fe-4S ferredoxin n=1 Tax=Candidatus Xianfuyuplasma coldseepsis TaxID=2782163 RepID=A0A7L7KUQ1_9MOLU|nr:4Fe-4S binding protein [Xianfuyuplasma coldseepsis]QMS85498.1 4Fe-4S ferredoxin [Xianfuyuplasma coldseepsis]
MLNKNGVPSKDLILSRFPDNDILVKPKAITECYEEIPCNPCSTSCPFHAITVGDDINTPPQVDFELCTGCGICVYNCPGLAIFTVQIKGDYAIYKIPYEFVPRPQKGDIMDAVNRNGDVIGQCLIEKVTFGAKQDKTALLQVQVPVTLLHEFITVRRPL